MPIFLAMSRKLVPRYPRSANNACATCSTRSRVSAGRRKSTTFALTRAAEFFETLRTGLRKIYLTPVRESNHRDFGHTALAGGSHGLFITRRTIGSNVVIGSLGNDGSNDTSSYFAQKSTVIWYHDSFLNWSRAFGSRPRCRA